MRSPLIFILFLVLVYPPPHWVPILVLELVVAFGNLTCVCAGLFYEGELPWDVFPLFLAMITANVVSFCFLPGEFWLYYVISAVTGGYLLFLGIFFLLQRSVVEQKRQEDQQRTGVIQNFAEFYRIPHELARELYEMNHGYFPEEQMQDLWEHYPRKRGKLEDWEARVRERFNV